MHYQTQVLPEAIDFTALSDLKPSRYPASLISTESNDHNGRYDILLAFPQQTISLDNTSSLQIDGRRIEDTFLSAFDRCWKQEKIAACDASKKYPFTGGWFVFLSYELAAEIEPSLDLAESTGTLPVALAMRCPAAIIYDHKDKRCLALAENDYVHVFDQITQDIKQLQSKKDEPAPIVTHSITESDTAPYLSQLDRIKRYIKDGDIFQANLSRLWELQIGDCTDAGLFKQLARSNPGSFAALIQFKHQTIISSSPERLVSVSDQRIQTRPIAGTRPRASQSEADQNLSAELLSHPKEQAEHIMLIDLERNDLGRICVPGSIRVDELMTLESYRHVHHIVSNVTGKLRDDVSPGEVIRAVFPGGTITGCPKVRCMQILTDMEQQPRGAYTGSLGYINRDGSMDLNILIRTMVRQGDTISFRAGGGIVADSDPQRELEETRAKAKGLLKVFSH